jgi:alpha-glucosidase (family GH31 glycosyl hydrolase)
MKKLSTSLVLMGLVGFLLWFAFNRKNDSRITNGEGQTLLLRTGPSGRLHFAWLAKGQDVPSEIPVTEMVSGSSTESPLTEIDGLWQSDLVSVRVERPSLCFRVTVKASAAEVGQFCPSNLGQREAGIAIDAPSMENVYGLGEQFLTPGKFDGDWVGTVRDSGSDPAENNRGQHFGNNMHGYNGGAVGNANFPVMYAIGKENRNFAFFFDNTYKQRWDFTAKIWKVETSGGALQGYVLTGPDLPALRAQYMDLTGHPPVPPKKAFGLWVSEYGFENWAELEDKLKTLRANKFPIDGFVLDLQWFGGIRKDDEASPMGGLTWDTKNFPEPAAKIAALAREEQIGIVAIEEPFISKGVIDPASQKTVHEILEQKGYLATEKPERGSKAALIDYNPWWGRGGIFDYSNPEAAAFWHDFRRQPLIEMNLTGHWTDLGEPEMFVPEAFYSGGRFKHADIHNIYNLLWSKSIYDGYERHKVARRPWILSRSGTSGIQRFGAAMWSGDIGSNLSSLTAHLNTQMHMSFSGMDYFGSDIGGFHRKGLQGDENEMYTQWFAAGSLLDVPVRVHTFNLENNHETAPDRIGDRASNLFNLRQRYALLPYYYSLAHLAFEKGEPVFAPLVFYFQNDPNARQLGDHKMVGQQLLGVTASRHGQRAVDVYLPKGDWFEFRTGKLIASTGDWQKNVPLYDGKIFRLPLYARAGSIFPMSRITEKTRNVNGSEPLIRVFPAKGTSAFTQTDDDGETIAYKNGDRKLTKITQSVSGGAVQIQVDGAKEGSLWLEVATPGVTKIFLNGTELKNVKNVQELEKADRGWTPGDKGFVIAKASGLSPGAKVEWKLETKP